MILSLIHRIIVPEQTSWATTVLVVTGTVITKMMGKMMGTVLILGSQTFQVMVLQITLFRTMRPAT